jgi:glyoxylate/hydroxypyruvate reductase A
MVILFKSDASRSDHWVRAFAQQAPEMELRLYPEVGRPEDIDYALVWQPPPGLLATLPRLRAIFSVGAGVDHLASDPDLPAGVPLVRMVEPGLSEGMSEYVAMHVLMHHRFFLDYQAQQRAHVWEEIQQLPAAERRVGILGVGALGLECVARLRPFGFQLLGWSREPKVVSGVTCFHGPEGLRRMLPQTDILVSLLPLTPATRNLLDRKVFGALPRGASYINAARGGQQVEKDLLEALASGQLAGASLDVFQQEPLPPESPFWDHPRVLLTPHVAAMTMAPTAVAQVIANIRRFERGEPLQNTVDLVRGY